MSGRPASIFRPKTRVTLSGIMSGTCPDMSGGHELTMFVRTDFVTKHRVGNLVPHPNPDQP